MNRVVLSGLVVFIAACADVVGPAPDTMLDSGLLVDSGLVDSGLVDSGLPDTGPPPPPCPIRDGLWKFVSVEEVPGKCLSFGWVGEQTLPISELGDYSGCTIDERYFDDGCAVDIGSTCPGSGVVESTFLYWQSSEEIRGSSTTTFIGTAIEPDCTTRLFIFGSRI